jgi:hypothetical protein
MAVDTKSLKITIITIIYNGMDTTSSNIGIVISIKYNDLDTKSINITIITINQGCFIQKPSQ